MPNPGRGTRTRQCRGVNLYSGLIYEDIITGKKVRPVAFPGPAITMPSVSANSLGLGYS